MMKSDLAMTNGLHIQDVSFSYRRQSEVLKNLSFSVPRGRVVGILGANGAGKSTLFKLILGVLPLQSGEIKINGRSVKTLSNRERAKQMAYIPQTQRGTFQFTVAEMVLMGTTASFSMFSQPGKRERIKAAEAMKLLQIEQFSDRLFDQLSGGEQQLVLIARAVAQDAPILIMDEPTASLDYGNQIRVLEEIRQLANRGYLVLISTHNPQHIFLYADDVLLIDGGTAIAFGKPQDVLSETLLSHVYRVPIQLEKSVRTEMVTVLPHFEKMRNHDMTDRKTDCKHACERTL
ncbi:MAG: ABC transporter ATP-binding protein [Saccharofermentanales bacterium]|jgi:iron complex transport system ATP-binding protein